jgi:hypothetical protein
MAALVVGIDTPGSWTYSQSAMVARKPKTHALKPKDVNPRTKVAYHEAGHAVLSAAIANKPRHVSIRPEGTTLGRSGARASVRPTTRVQEDLAGFAAEHLLTGRRPRQVDEDVGFAIIARLDPEMSEAFVGSEDRDGYCAVQEVLGMVGFEADDEIKREVDRFYDIARESLSVVWRTVEGVAQALLRYKELDRDRLNEALGDADIHAPVIAVQLAHGLLKVRPSIPPQTSTRLWQVFGIQGHG